MCDSTIKALVVYITLLLIPRGGVGYGILLLISHSFVTMTVNSVAGPQLIGDSDSNPDSRFLCGSDHTSSWIGIRIRIRSSWIQIQEKRGGFGFSWIRIWCAWIRILILLILEALNWYRKFCACKATVQQTKFVRNAPMDLCPCLLGMKYDCITSQNPAAILSTQYTECSELRK